MAPWGGLNPALTAWREGINAHFPRRGRASDGGYADQAHGSTSQHQADADGTVDAFDMDVNLLGSGTPTGTPRERQAVEALKLDFEADGRGELWIHQREIANRGIGNWRERGYGGENPHSTHVHWQSRQATERNGRPWAFRHTEALVQRWYEEDNPMDAADVWGTDGLVLAPPDRADPSNTHWTPAAVLADADQNARFAARDAAAARAELSVVRGQLDTILARLDQLAARLPAAPPVEG